VLNEALSHEDVWRSGGIVPSPLVSELDANSGKLYTPAALP
jgi:hypothetical protein